MMGPVKMEKGSGNIFADLGFSPEESVNLSARSLLMMNLADWYKGSGLTQAQAAKSLGTTQPRFNDLLKGKIDKFSLDALVTMLARVGMRVEIKVTKATLKAKKKTPLKKAA